MSIGLSVSVELVQRVGFSMNCRRDKISQGREEEVNLPIQRRIPKVSVMI